jgi:hypothetical protein
MEISALGVPSQGSTIPVVAARRRVGPVEAFVNGQWRSIEE